MQKVLLVEDNLILLEAIETYLTGLDLEVESRHTTENILQEIPDMDLSLAILDVWVKPIQGDEISLSIKNSQKIKPFPIILISAKDDLNITAKNACADDHLHKPFRLPELGSKVLSLIE
jgi:two-component system OmpR family response regulator